MMVTKQHLLERADGIIRRREAATVAEALAMAHDQLRELLLTQLQLAYLLTVRSLTTGPVLVDPIPRSATLIGLPAPSEVDCG